MFDFRPQDFDIVRFFSYTSTIPADSQIFYYDGMNRPNSYLPNIREKFDHFEDELRDYATDLWKEKTGDNHWFQFHDNKCVYQLKHKETGKTYFFGHYDGYRFIGTSVYLYAGNIFDFKKFIITDFIEDVRCDGGCLWKKFEM